jgi:hypothetical protein
VAERKPFLLRIDREVLDAVQRWADDDLRSLNGQIEFLLRGALLQAGRHVKGSGPDDVKGRAPDDVKGEGTREKSKREKE